MLLHEVLPKDGFSNKSMHNHDYDCLTNMNKPSVYVIEKRNVSVLGCKAEKAIW